jgi:nitrite reductase (NADH) large subunit
MMQHLVDTYQCEWAAVVRDPEKRKWFRQFANTDETESDIEIVSERGQTRPADWPSDFISLEQFRSTQRRGTQGAALSTLGAGANGNHLLNGHAASLNGSNGSHSHPVASSAEAGAACSSTQGAQSCTPDASLRWIPLGRVADFPRDGGATVRYGQTQLAIYHFASRGEWFASQNMCPHKKAFVLSRGILGDAKGEPKVACPLHKKTFSLNTGESLQGEEYRIRTFRVKVEADEVLVELPPPEVLDAELATSIGCSLATSCEHASHQPVESERPDEVLALV